MPSSPTTSATAGPSSVSSPSAANAPSSLYSGRLHNGEGGPSASAYSSGYSSFPSAAQSPPTTASTMRPSLSGFAPPGSSASFASSIVPPPPPRQPFPFSHDDTDRSRLAYETLSASAKAYRVALGQLSAAASNFGSALEACARLKEARAQPYPPGPYAPARGGNENMTGSSIGLGNVGSSGSSLHEASCTADVLLATSGLYYLMANQQGILAETVYRSFELPIVHELDRYGADVEAEQESYAAGIRDASREIRRLEKEGVKLRKPRQRDVGRMRDHLVAMTEALDALTVRQGEHAVTLLDQSRDMSGTVSQASRNLVRAEVDILDSLARKGWPGGGLDVVLDGAVDLFSRNGYDDDDDDLGGGGGGLLLGGTSNGAGIVGSSSHAVVSGAGGFLGSGVAPKLSLLGGGGAPVSSSGNFDDDVDDGDDDGDDADDFGDDEGTGIDDEASEVSTINGNVRSSSRATGNGNGNGNDATPSSTSGGGGFFSILTGGSILGRKSEPRAPSQDPLQDHDEDRARGRSPRKGQRSSVRSQQSQQSQKSQQSRQSQEAIDEGASIKEEDEDEDEGKGDNEEDADNTITISSVQPAAPQEQQQQQQRYSRADSLAVDTYQHQYQSLDSLAHAEASSSVAGSDAGSIHGQGQGGRGASASRRKAAQKGKGTTPKLTPTASANSSRGRSRPFSPQRVSVDPQEDLFSGQFSSPERKSLAWLKEGEQLETPQEEKGEDEAGGLEENDEDDLRSQASVTSSSRNKGKGKAKAAESGRTTPAAPASRASSSARPTPDIKHEETDEGVYIWRHEG